MNDTDKREFQLKAARRLLALRDAKDSLLPFMKLTQFNSVPLMKPETLWVDQWCRPDSLVGVDLEPRDGPYTQVTTWLQQGFERIQFG